MDLADTNSDDFEPIKLLELHCTGLDAKTLHLATLTNNSFTRIVPFSKWSYVQTKAENSLRF